MAKTKNPGKFLHFKKSACWNRILCVAVALHSTVDVVSTDTASGVKEIGRETTNGGGNGRVEVQTVLFIQF